MELLTVPSGLITGARESSSKAIEIIATDEVVAYGVNKQRYSNDAFLALPVDALGREYYAVTWSEPGRTPMANILMVGVYDGTSVSVTFPPSSAGFSNIVTADGNTYSAEETLTVSLEIFE